jgi:soluble lytic murein transglycosylase
MNAARILSTVSPARPGGARSAAARAWRLSLLALAWGLGLAQAWAMSGDEAVQKAEQAYRSHKPRAFAALVQPSRGHVLQPYVDYWQLALGLDQAPDPEVADFLKRNAGTVLAERLAGDWVRELARRERWDAIDAAATAGGLAHPEPDLGCLLWQARLQTGDAGPLREARALWGEAKAFPESCLPVMDQLVASGAITTDQVWQRIRSLLQANLVSAARQAAGYLPAREQADLQPLFRGPFNARKYLAGAGQAASRAQTEILVYALTRLSRDDPDEAWSLFDARFQAQLSPADQRAVCAQMALSAARLHQPEALVWFAMTDPRSLSDEQWRWWVRSALRLEDWQAVRSTIEAMPARLRAESAWIYWYGRALAALGDEAGAQAQYRRIRGQFEFYGRLASEALGEPQLLPPRPAAAASDLSGEVAANLALQRAIALFRLDLRADAVREWNWGIRNYDDARLLAAAELARRAEIWDRAINTAERTVDLQDFGLRFLAPYLAVFTDQARQAGLNEAWVLGLARQESRFIPKVRSPAGALGLMQLMPSTAQMVGRRLGITPLRTDDILAVDTNVRLGTSYLSQVAERFDGHPLLASAAYNAGPGRAERWRAERPLEGAIYAETIPFNETRDYVKKVLSNAVYYAQVLQREPLTLKALLSVVQGRDGAEREAAH